MSPALAPATGSGYSIHPGVTRGATGVSVAVTGEVTPGPPSACGRTPGVELPHERPLVGAIVTSVWGAALGSSRATALPKNSLTQTVPSAFASTPAGVPPSVGTTYARTAPVAGSRRRTVLVPVGPGPL